MTALDVSQSFEQEGARVLAEVERMSQRNSTWLSFDVVGPWGASFAARALDRFTRPNSRAEWPNPERDRVVRALFALVPDVTHFDVTHALTRPPTERRGDQSRFVKRLRVGTKPTDYVQPRPGYRDALACALSWRSRCARDYSSGFVSAVVRTTHRKVHEALAGAGEGVGSPGCKWCKG